MNNLPVDFQREKINAFQKLRLALFRLQKYNIKKYEKAPDYIKRDDKIIEKIIMRSYAISQDAQKELLLIPRDKLIEIIKDRPALFDKFEPREQIKLLQSNSSLRLLKKEEMVNLIDIALKDNNYQFFENLENKYKEDYLETLDERGTLDKQIPNILSFLGENNIDEILQKRPELIEYLNDEQQLKFVNKHPESIKSLRAEMQIKYIKEDFENLALASEEIQEYFVQKNKENLPKTSYQFQLKAISKNPDIYEFASDEVKKDIFENTDSRECMEASRALLKKDITNSKHINFHNGTMSSKDSNKECQLEVVFEDINKEDIKTIESLFLHSKLIGAKGKLLSQKTVLHGCLGEGFIEGMDDYSSEQIRTIQSLNKEQMKQLINIDCNYVLPYLSGEEVMNLRPNGYILREKREDTLNKARKKCGELFVEIFGEKKFEELKPCIDTIYDMQSDYNPYFFTSGVDASDYNRKMEQLKMQECVPLDNLKILFNSKIISSNSSEDIIKYFDKEKNNEDTNETFKALMQKAYGDTAKDILDSRPNLNVHTINSLESFDERITNNFSHGFVHDLLSYNIRDFSEFLSIAKDSSKLENFKTYYDVLSNVMGENVETMQKAISEYMYNDKLLENVKNNDLDDLQSRNLISILCTRDNRYNINTLDELENYKEISKAQIKRNLEISYEDSLRMVKENKNSENYNSRPIKKCICEDFLGLPYAMNYKVRNYGNNFKEISSLYDLQSEEGKRELYDSSEYEILKVMHFIEKEQDIEKLKELSAEFLQQNIEQNPVALYGAIDKIKEHQLEIFNESLLIVEKMEKLAKEYEGKENAPIKKEIIKGIPKYTLEGIPFRFLIHDKGTLDSEDFEKYDGQLGNSNICSRLVSNNNILKGKYGDYGFTHIKKEDGIVSYWGGDAKTTHLPKLVKGKGHITKINNNIDDSSVGNEIATYRRHRSHNNISNENRGGKILPDIIIEYEKKEEDKYSEEYLNAIKNRNQVIVYIDKDRYLEIEKQNDKEKHKEEQQIEGTELLNSGIKATELTTKISTIREQVSNIKSIQQEKNQSKKIEDDRLL